MKHGLKKLLYGMFKANLMFGSIISIILLILGYFYAAVGFFLGLIIYYISFLIKAYMLNKLLVKNVVKKGSIIVIETSRILVVALFCLFFKDSLSGLISYCLGITFNYFSVGFAFLRDERGSE